MNAIAYKVVARRYGFVNGSPAIFFSAMKRHLPDEFALEYKMNETTYPKMGRIFVFKDLASARAFIIDNEETFSIFEGLPTDVGHIKHLSTFFDRTTLGCFWRNKAMKKRQDQHLKKSIYAGTMSCSSFTPTKWISGN